MDRQGWEYDHLTATPSIDSSADDLLEVVGRLLVQAADREVMPYFGPGLAEVHEKSPGEWVTLADRACEAYLTRELQALIPGSRVVGEEAVASHPELLSLLDSDEPVWLLDPLDGTSNFARGKSPFAIMVALVQAGEPTHSWILDPKTQELSVSKRGAGAWVGGDRQLAQDESRRLEQMTGAVLRRFLPDGVRSRVESTTTRFRSLRSGSLCAGRDYVDVVRGDLDFVLYWRTLPWDHIPGAALLREAGGVARRPDGREYTGRDHAGTGLLIARNEHEWLLVAEALFS